MFCCRSALALVMSGMLWAAAARVAPPAVAQGERAGVGADFQAFLEEVWPDAQAKGIARAVFEQAFAGLAPDPRVIAATQRQPEYGKPVGAYINSVASPARIATGTKKAWQWSETFAAVEKRFAVERWVI